MERRMLVTLLQKNIDELVLLTEGFMDMNEYPTAIIQLAKRKTDDIHSYIDQLAEVKQAPVVAAPTEETISETSTPVITTSEDVTEAIETADELQEEPIFIELPEEEEIDEEILVSNETTAAEVIVAPAIEAEPEVRLEVIQPVEIVETTIVETTTIEALPDANTPPEFVAVEDKITNTKSAIDEPKKGTIVDKITSPTISRNELHSRNGNSLSTMMANKKVEDVKQAISIGDRFRFQRELFGGNGEEMNKALNYINQLYSMDEVLSFLSKYRWEKDNETAEDFRQIIRRKFL